MFISIIFRKVIKMGDSSEGRLMMFYRLLLVVVFGALCWSPTESRVIHKRAAFYIANETMCIVDGEVYRNGDPVPTDDECERCTCRPPGFSCVLRDCDTKPGCKAVRKAGECCPEYVCGCVHNNRLYEDGELIKDLQNNCYTCRCHGSSISCTFADCLFRGDCPPEYIPGECCPRYDHCPPLSTTTTTTTTPIIQQEIEFVNLTTKHLEKFTSEDTTVTIQDITSTESGSSTFSYDTAENTLFTVKFTLSSEKFSSIHDYDVTELTTLLPLQTVSYQETTRQFVSPSGTVLTTLKEGLIISGTDESTTEQSSTHESTTEQSGTQESTTEQIGTQESTTEQSSTQESTTEQSSTHESITEQSDTDESTTEQSATDGSTSENQSALVFDVTTTQTKTASTEKESVTSYTTEHVAGLSEVESTTQDSEPITKDDLNDLEVKNITTNQPVIETSKSDLSLIEEEGEVIIASEAETSSSVNFTEMSTVKQADDIKSFDLITSEEINETTIQTSITHSVSESDTSVSEDEQQEETEKVQVSVGTQATSTQYIDTSSETASTSTEVADDHTVRENYDDFKSESTTQQAFQSTSDELHASSQDFHTFTLLQEESKVTELDSEDLHTGSGEKETSSESFTTKEQPITKISKTELHENGLVIEHDTETSTTNSETQTPTIVEFSTFAHANESATSIDHQEETPNFSYVEEHENEEFSTEIESDKISTDSQETSSFSSIHLKTTSDKFTENTKVTESENLETTTHQAQPVVSSESSQSHDLLEIDSETKSHTEESTKFSETSTITYSDVVTISKDNDSTLSIQKFDVSVSENESTSTDDLIELDSSIDDSHAVYHHTETAETAFTTKDFSQSSSPHDATHIMEETSSDSALSSLPTISDQKHDTEEISDTILDASAIAANESLIVQASTSLDLEEETTVSSYSKSTTIEEIKSSTLFEEPVKTSESLIDDVSTTSEIPTKDFSYSLSETETETVSEKANDIRVSSDDATESDTNLKNSAGTEIMESSSSLSVSSDGTEEKAVSFPQTTKSYTDKSTTENLDTTTSDKDYTTSSENNIHWKTSFAEGTELDAGVSNTNVEILSTGNETQEVNKYDLDEDSNHEQTTPVETINFSVKQSTVSEARISSPIATVSNDEHTSDLTLTDGTATEAHYKISTGDSITHDTFESESTTAEDKEKTHIYSSDILSSSDNEEESQKEQTSDEDFTSTVTTFRNEQENEIKVDKIPTVAKETTVSEESSFSVEHSLPETLSPNEDSVTKEAETLHELKEIESASIGETHDAETEVPMQPSTSEEINEAEVLHKKHDAELFAAHSRVSESTKSPEITSLKPVTEKISTTQESSMPSEIPAFEPPLANILKQPMIFTKPTVSKERNSTLILSDDIQKFKINVTEYKPEENDLLRLSLSLAEEDNGTAVNISSSDDLTDEENKVFVIHHEYTIPDSEVNDIDILDSEEADDILEETENPIHKFNINNEESLTSIANDEVTKISSESEISTSDSTTKHTTTKTIGITEENDSLTSLISNDETSPQSYTEEEIPENQDNKSHLLTDSLNESLLTDTGDNDHKSPNLIHAQNVQDILPSKIEVDSVESSSTLENISLLPDYSSEDSTSVEENKNHLQITETGVTITDSSDTAITTFKKTEFNSQEETTSTEYQEHKKVDEIQIGSETSDHPQYESTTLFANKDLEDEDNHITETGEIEPTTDGISSTTNEHDNSTPNSDHTSEKTIEKEEITTQNSVNIPEVPLTEQTTSSETKDSPEKQHELLDSHQNETDLDYAYQDAEHTELSDDNGEMPPINAEAENGLPADFLSVLQDISSSLHSDRPDSSETTVTDKDADYKSTTPDSKISDPISTIKINVFFGQNFPQIPNKYDTDATIISQNDKDNLEPELFHLNNDDVSESMEIKTDMSTSSEATTSDHSDNINLNIADSTTEVKVLLPSASSLNEDYHDTNADINNPPNSTHDLDEAVASEETRDTEVSETSDEITNSTNYVGENFAIDHTFSSSESEPVSSDDFVSVPEDTTSPFTILEYLGDLFSGLSTFSASSESNKDTTTQMNFAQTTSDHILEKTIKTSEETETKVNSSSVSNESYSSFLKNQFAEYGSLGGVFLTGQSKYNGSTIDGEKQQQNTNTLVDTLNEDVLSDNDTKPIDSTRSHVITDHKVDDVRDDVEMDSEEDERFSEEESSFSNITETHNLTFSTKDYSIHESLNSNNQENSEKDETTLNSEEFHLLNPSDKLSTTENSSVDSNVERHDPNNGTDFETQTYLNNFSTHGDILDITETSKSDDEITYLPQNFRNSNYSQNETNEASGPEKGGEWFEPNGEPKSPLLQSAGVRNTSDVTPLSDITEYSSAAEEHDNNHGPEKGGDVFEPAFPEVFPISSITSEVKNGNNSNYNTSDVEAENGSEITSNTRTSDYTGENVSSTESEIKVVSEDADTHTDSILISGNVPPLPILMKTFNNHIPSNSGENVQGNSAVSNNSPQIPSTAPRDKHVDARYERIPSKVKISRSIDDPYHLTYVISRGLKAEKPDTLFNDGNNHPEKESHFSASNLELDENVYSSKYMSDINTQDFQTPASPSRSLKESSKIKNNNVERQRRDTAINEEHPVKSDNLESIASSHPSGSSEDFYAINNKHILLVEGFGQKPGGFHPVTSSFIIVHSDDENETEEKQKSKPPAADAVGNISEIEFLDDSSSGNFEKSGKTSNFKKTHPEK